MTKTFTAVVPYRSINLGPLANMPFDTNAGASSVWDFEFWLLEFV
jgi:hypothetical protein